MKIATVVLTHANIKLTTDTVQSIETWVGDRVLVVVDQVGWPKFNNIKISDAKVIEGFYHAHKRSPYRNYTLGLKSLFETWPDCDWYLYCECDCLFTSDKFKDDLSKAETKNAWCVGVDLRRHKFSFPLLEKILNQGTINQSYYFLGCCQFHHHDFIEKLHSLRFFDKFISETQDFEKGYFPDYTRWAFEEELWPTLAAHLGGNLYELCCWKGDEGREFQGIKTDPHMFYAGAEHDQWRGHYKVYPVRNSPELAPEEIRPETSVAHPVKTALDPIRVSQQEKRRLERKRLLTLF